MSYKHGFAKTMLLLFRFLKAFSVSCFSIFCGWLQEARMSLGLWWMRWPASTQMTCSLPSVSAWAPTLLSSISVNMSMLSRGSLELFLAARDTTSLSESLISFLFFSCLLILEDAGLYCHSCSRVAK